MIQPEGTEEKKKKKSVEQIGSTQTWLYMDWGILGVNQLSSSFSSVSPHQTEPTTTTTTAASAVFNSLIDIS